MANKKYTAKEINRIVTDYRDLIKYIQSNDSVLDAIIDDSTKAFCDLRHYVELQYPSSRKEKTKIIKAIKDVSDRRRKAKDEKELCSHLLKLYSDSRRAQELFTAANSTNKVFEKIYVNDRHYQPRILFDLFEGTDND